MENKKDKKIYEGKYCPALIICHGESEYILFSQIKSVLRIPIEIYVNHHSNISIESIPDFLKLRFMKSPNFFTGNFPRAYIKKCKNQFVNFRLIFVMDVDSASPSQVSSFQNKETYKNHWAYPYAMPILSNPNLDVAMTKAGYKIDISEKKKSYYSLLKDWSFESVKRLNTDLRKIKESNLSEALDYILSAYQSMNT
jgi:hypothetical protein